MGRIQELEVQLACAYKCNYHHDISWTNWPAFDFPAIPDQPSKYTSVARCRVCSYPANALPLQIVLMV